MKYTGIHEFNTGTLVSTKRKRRRRLATTWKTPDGNRTAHHGFTAFGRNTLVFAIPRTQGCVKFTPNA